MTEETIRVCGVNDIADGAAKSFMVTGRQVAVVRLGDTYYAIGDRCSHANFSLAEGEVDAKDCSLECPQHGSRFSLTTGVPATLPATKAVPVYSVRVEGDDVMITSEPVS